MSGDTPSVPPAPDPVPLPPAEPSADPASTPAPGATNDLSPLHVRRATADWHLEEGRVVLQVPKFGPRTTRVLRFLRLPPTVRLRLDPLGSDAWQGMDGRTVGALAQHLRDRYPEEDAVPERLGVFVSLLVDRGLVRLDLDAPQA